MSRTLIASFMELILLIAEGFIMVYSCLTPFIWALLDICLPGSHTTYSCFQGSEINGRITHEEVNRLVRQFKGRLSGQVKSNLQKLRLQIHKALEGEDNYTVFIYISDELDDPIKFVSGAGENELVIDIEEDGIDYTWTKTTFWKKTKDFFKAAAQKIIQGLQYVWGEIKSIAGAARKALTWD